MTDIRGATATMLRRKRLEDKPRSTASFRGFLIGLCIEGSCGVAGLRFHRGVSAMSTVKYIDVSEVRGVFEAIELRCGGEVLELYGLYNDDRCDPVLLAEGDDMDAVEAYGRKLSDHLGVQFWIED